VKAMAATQVIKTAAKIENLFISGTSERNANSLLLLIVSSPRYRSGF